VIGVLTNRIEFIECLQDEQKEIPEIVEELDTSRSTVDRAARELETLDLIEYDRDGFTLTSCGQIALLEYTRFTDSLKQIWNGQNPPGTTATELISSFSSKTELIDCLSEAPLDKRGLIDELDISRSTIDRGIRDLEVLELIGLSDSGYELTEYGRAIVEKFRQFEERIEVMIRLKPILQYVDPAYFDVDLTIFADADLYLPEPGNSQAMIDRHVELLKEVKHGRSLLPITGLHAGKEVREPFLKNEDRYQELVVAPKVAELFQSNPKFQEVMGPMVETGRIEVFLYDGDIPYFVGVYDETVQMGAEEGDVPRGIVESDSAEVNAWAEGVYNEYKQEAEQIIP
jgi:predicted transcriptional regulator